jgi:polyferredoxin/tetratricopeptide (TPR) repeat protein
MGRRRAVALIVINGLIVAHLFLWLAMGRTLSPVEPSEAMQTLETGVINAGFVFYAGAIVLTLIFGRYVCGWACHIIALQDLCRWLMLRIGIRPRPFRSRLLVYVPLVLALYMFVWPNFKRYALFPLLDTLGAGRPVWLKPVPPPMGFEAGFLVDDFWATMPGWVVAIPFLLVVGFAAVYFLGAKGFCTYGCPYGGFFAPADKLSPVRVRVTDACEGCGQCTAACSSNVRVHEEVRAFGMVVDSGCMKTMDCIAACPNEALYIGAGLPAVLARPKDEAAREDWKKTKARRKRTLDPSLVEEFVVGLAFLLMFFGYRGMFEQVPMLMAVGMAGIGAFGVWMSMRILRDANARLYGFKFKRDGRVRGAGVVFVALTLIAVTAAGWSAAIQYQRWRGDLMYTRVLVPSALALSPGFVPAASDVARADKALAHYARADSPGHGGLGWRLTPDELLRVAYLQVVRGDLPAAEAALREIVVRGNPTDALVLELAQVMRAQGADEVQIAATLGEALTLHEGLNGLRRQIALRAAAADGMAVAQSVWDAAPESVREEPAFWLARARFWMAIGSADKAHEAMATAHAMLGDGGRKTTGMRVDLAEMALATGDTESAVKYVDEASALGTRDLGLQLRIAGILLTLGRTDQGRTWLERGTEHTHAPVGVLTTGAQLYAQLGEIETATALMNRAAERAAGKPWELAQVGATMISLGRGLEQGGLVDRGIEIVVQASSEKPDSVALAERVALIYAGVERYEDAAAAMGHAAELGASSVLLAQRAAELYEHVGNEERGQYWREQAAAREASQP